VCLAVGDCALQGYKLAATTDPDTIADANAWATTTATL
jgi:hypothetical protein